MTIILIIFLASLRRTATAAGRRAPRVWRGGGGGGGGGGAAGVGGAPGAAGVAGVAGVARVAATRAVGSAILGRLNPGARSPTFEAGGPQGSPGQQTRG